MSVTHHIPPSAIPMRGGRLPEHPGMPLVDVNGVRLAKRIDTQSVERAADQMLWCWDIAAHTGRGQRKRTLRFLIREVNEPGGDGVVMQTFNQVIERMLGTERAEWSVTEISNLLMCSKEHVYALLRGRALTKTRGASGNVRIPRASLVSFLTARLQ